VGPGPARPDKVFLLFVDGLGVGPTDPARNPLITAAMPNLAALIPGWPPVAAEGGAVPVAAVAPGGWVPLDSQLGVPGLPQSATGQTTLLTGVNAARLAGRHVNARPTAVLRTVIAEHSIFLALAGLGKRGVFTNAFGWDSLAAIERGERAASATTLAFLAGGGRLRNVDDLLAGRAAYHDITGEALAARGYDVPRQSPAQAGAAAAAAVGDAAFGLFEYFLTDLAGHAQDMSRAQGVLERLDTFIGGLCGDLDLCRNLLVITSDHGNVEDLSVRAHTTNAVPLAAAGAGAAGFLRGARRLDEVAGRILKVLGRPERRSPKCS
jgi:2,3-bisphosphoglycerate-independent phosphoglycerate mutase